jgi:hypothetical protein
VRRGIIVLAAVCGAVALVSSASAGVGVTRGDSEPAHAAPLIPTPIGVGRAYHPGPGAVTGSAIHGMRCIPGSLQRFGVHVEFFADRQVVLLPGGIGVAPPRAWAGGDLTGGRCSYPLRTTDPTGLIQVARGRRATLGDLFAIWGRQLGTRRLLGFHGQVRVYLGGRRVFGDPQAVPLKRHAEIVLEVGGYVPPHRAYLFPRGV